MAYARYEFVNCGSCKRCLTGARVHGPYLYYYEGSGKNRRHLWGSGGRPTISLAENPEEVLAEEERMRERAEAEYERRLRRMTAEQLAQRENVMGRIAALKRVEVKRRRETKKRVKKAEAEGLGARAIKEIKKQVAAQFEAELKELKAQVKKERDDLWKMLGDAA